jgi:hypothetical protein
MRPIIVLVLQAAAAAASAAASAAACPAFAAAAADAAFWSAVTARVYGSGTVSVERRQRLAHFEGFVAQHQATALEASGGASSLLPRVLDGTAASGPAARTAAGQLVRAAGFVPGLPTAVPFVAPSDYPKWVGALVARLGEVEAELAAVLASRDAAGAAALFGSLGEHHGATTGWEQATLVEAFDVQAAGVAAFPRTHALLREVGAPTGPRHTAVARQLPRTGIPEHCDMQNWMLTLHLPLRVEGGHDERGVGIVVNGERREWRCGVPSVMDTSFPHRTFSEADAPLYMLLVDFWHPALTTEECEALEFFFREAVRVQQGT